MKLTVQAAGTFEVGRKVGLHYRLGDYAGDHGAHLGDAIAAATVKDDGSITFNSKAIVAGGRYWVGGRDVHGRFRSVSVTAADPEQDTSTFDSHEEVPDDVQAQLRKQMQPPSTTIGNVVEGARSTTSTRKQAPAPVVAASSLPELHEPQKTPDTTQPVGVADAEGPLASQTPMGTAVPPAEQPPSQPDTEGVPQASDTALGTATPLSEEEVAAQAPPEERKPRAKAPKRNKAASKSNAKTKRARTRSAQTKAQRSAAAKKAAATRKRNAKKGGR